MPGKRVKHKVLYGNRGWMPFYFGFVPSKKAWDKEVRRLKAKGPWPEYPTAAARTTECVNRQGKLICLVTINERFDAKTTVAEIAGLAAHEGQHVFRFVRELIGEESPSAEFDAYALQNIVQDLIDAYVETRSPNIG